MTRDDFEYDQQDFPAAFSKAEIGYRRSKQELLENVAHWQSLADRHFNNIKFTVSPGSELIEGEVIGKKFQIQISPLTVGESTYALAVLAVIDGRTGKGFEVARFLGDVDGGVRSLAGEVLLNQQEESHVSYRLLIALIRKVLSSAPKA